MSHMSNACARRRTNRSALSGVTRVETNGRPPVSVAANIFMVRVWPCSKGIKRWQHARERANAGTPRASAATAAVPSTTSAHSDITRAGRSIAYLGQRTEMSLHAQRLVQLLLNLLLHHLGLERVLVDRRHQLEADVEQAHGHLTQRSNLSARLARPGGPTLRSPSLPLKSSISVETGPPHSACAKSQGVSHRGGETPGGGCGPPGATPACAWRQCRQCRERRNAR
jgi:hypothetical protein